MARPQKPIDLKLLEDLARIQCTDEEMASILGFTREGFRKRKQRQPELVGVIEKGKEAGRCSLRRLQWKSATGGNITMQIWLGKQYLGQTDRQMTELSGAVGHTDPALQRLVGLLEGVTQEQARELLSVAARSMSSRHAVAALPPPAAEEAG
jgi:hypothetical protein